MVHQVIIVEDSASMRALVAGTLQTLRCQTHEASNGQEALQKLTVLGKIDLVITDLNMPLMGGIAFLQALRKMSDMRFVPVLILTTETRAEKRQQARSAGATGWLTKPFDPQQLIEAVHRLLV
jgi:two-component system chemotaxis response regulator CheY